MYYWPCIFFKFFFWINCPVTCHPGPGEAVQKYQGEIFFQWYQIWGWGLVWGGGNCEKAIKNWGGREWWKGYEKESIWNEKPGHLNQLEDS